MRIKTSVNKKEDGAFKKASDELISLSLYKSDNFIDETNKIWFAFNRKLNRSNLEIVKMDSLSPN